VRGALMSLTSMIEMPDIQQPAYISAPQRIAWCRRCSARFGCGWLPPATFCPSIDQRETSTGFDGLRIS